MLYILILTLFSLVRISHCNIMLTEPHPPIDFHTVPRRNLKMQGPKLDSSMERGPINKKLSQIIPKCAHLKCIYSLAGVYGSQAFFTTASFCSIAGMIQYLQYFLNISCNEPLSFLFGLVTILLGGICSHKLAELITYRALAKLGDRYKTIGFTRLLVYPNQNHLLDSQMINKGKTFVI